MSDDEQDDDEGGAPTAQEILEAFPKIGSGKAEELAELLEKALLSDEDDAIDEALEAVNSAIDGHGVEGIQAEDGYKVDDYWRDTILLYVNMGDTYDTTICYDTEGEEFFVGSWGDFVEDWEKAEDEDDEEEDEEEEEHGDGDESEDDTSSLDEQEEEVE